MGLRHLRRAVGLVRRCAAAIVGIMVVAACAGRAPLREPLGEIPRAMNSPDSSWSETSPGEGPAVESIEDGVLDTGVLDATDQESIASKANDAAPERGKDGMSEVVGTWLESSGAPGVVQSQTAGEVTAATPRSSGGSCEVTAITGCHSETRCRVDGWRGFSGGARIGESFATGFVHFEGRGLIRRLHVGHMTLRAGERLILGRGIGSYGTSASACVRRGFSVSPSLSKWFGTTGAAVELGRGFWRFETLVAGLPQGIDGPTDRCLWSSLVRDLSRGSVGVVAAYSFPQSPEGAAQPCEPRLSAVGWHAMIRGDGLSASAEVAGWGGDVFFAGRLASRAKKGLWSVLVFRAPYEAPDEAAVSGTSVKTDQGMTLRLLSRVARVKTSVSLSAGRVWSRSALAAYRRFTARIERDGHQRVGWELGAYGKTRSTGDFATQPVVRETRQESSGDLVLRAGVRVRGRGAVGTTARIDYLPAVGGVGPGTVVSLATELLTSRIDTRVSLSAHSLSQGRRAFVSRPGLGPYEWFGFLYGRGSDLAVRLGVRVTERSRLLVFYGTSWRSAERLYVGAECRR